jgi:hypothetical protein
MVSYQKIFEELTHRKINYLIAGGFAVNFHQVQRATVDLDLIVHLKEDNLILFVAMMTELGFVPRIPVKATDFIDHNIRKDWISSKNIKVFTFIKPDNPFEIIDVFMEEPISFDEMWKNRFSLSAFGCILNVVGIDDLISMKKIAGREKDDYDIRQLERIKSMGK